MADEDKPKRSLTLAFRNEPAFDETAERNRQSLVAAAEHAAAGDPAAFWSIFDPDVTFFVSPQLPYGGTYEGIEATQRAYAEISATYSGMRSVIEAALASRDLCIFYQSVEFEVKANGNSGKLPIAEIFRFSNDKIIEWRVCYFDADLLTRSIRGT